MEPWMAALIGSITTVLASSGFWAYLQKRDTTKTAVAQLLMGLAYDKIMGLGVAYIERGWISKDEYEAFWNELYVPYKDIGGNGLAERVALEVSHLPIRSHTKYAEIDRKDQQSERERPKHEYR